MCRLLAQKTRRQKYLFRKYQLCKALMAEKEATIRRLECEIAGLQMRKERLGRTWKEAVERGE